MADLDHTWCELGEMEAWMCGCRIHAKAKGLEDIQQREAQAWPPIEGVIIVAEMVARHKGICDACRKSIEPGDKIVKIEVSMYWYHETCAEEAQEL